MVVLAQSIAVDLAPYLHIGYGAGATPMLELGLMMVVATALLAPLLMAVMLFWFDEAKALLGLIQSQVLGLPGQFIELVFGRTRDPP